MPEFLITAHIQFPRDTAPEEVSELLHLEAEAARPYLEAGLMYRVWHTWGEPRGSHGHVALWVASHELWVREAYRRFPLVKAGYLKIDTVLPLNADPNDPGTPLDTPVPMTWYWLSALIGAAREEGALTAMEHGAWVIPGQVSVHSHPESKETPQQIHVMAHDGETAQKVAEIGPPSGAGEARTPGYIDILAWRAGQPVHHRRLAARILADNNVLRGSYDAALGAPRTRHAVQGY